MKTFLSFLFGRGASAVRFTPTKLVYAITKADRDTALDAAETEAAAVRAKTVGKLDASREDNVKKIRDAKANVFSRSFRWMWNKVKDDSDTAKLKAVDSTLTDIAQARAAEIQARFDDAEDAAVQDIASKYHKNNRKLALYTAKTEITGEIIRDLESELGELQDLKGSYRKAIETLRGAKGLNAEIDDLKSRKGILKTLETRAKQDAAGTINKEDFDRVASLDNMLRTMLLKVDPEAASYMDQYIFENANGDSTKLEAKVEDLKTANKLTPQQHRLLVDLCMNLCGDKKRRFKPKLLTAYYGNALQKRGDINPNDGPDGKLLADEPRLKARMDKLETLSVGQWVRVALTPAGGSTIDVDLAVANVTKDKKFITLVDRSTGKLFNMAREKDAAGNYVLTTDLVKTPGAAGTPPTITTTEYKLSAPDLRPVNTTGERELLSDYKDPTKVYFDAKQ